VPHVLVLPGDGIGPEVTSEARAVLERVAPDLEFEEALIGGAAIEAEGVPLSDRTVERARACGLVLLGAVGGPAWDGLPAPEKPERGLLRIRKELELFANLRPAAVIPALVDSSPLRSEAVAGVDLIVVRELTGGIYFGEPRGRDDVAGLRRARNTMVYDEREIERIARVAFETASERRKLVTNIHKSNVLEVCGLWNEVVSEVARDYPHIELEHQLVDSAAMILLRDARHFDVLLCPNLFGDILSLCEPGRGLARPLRAGPRQRTGHRGTGCGEPARVDSLGRDAARARPGPRARGVPHPRGGVAGARGRPSHAGPGARGGAAGGDPGDGQARARGAGLMAGRGHRVALLGSTGAVGQELLAVLEERSFPVLELLPYGSEASAGTEIEFGGETLEVEPLLPAAGTWSCVRPRESSRSCSPSWKPARRGSSTSPAL
jgi:3-isopropylmalate dehydrogenase